MSDVEEYSHAARLGGLTTLQIDRFVAHEAAVNCTGPPSEKRALDPFVRQFHEFLKRAKSDHADRELRRRVLLMVTDGRSATSTTDTDASRIRKVADDMYSSIA